MELTRGQRELVKNSFLLRQVAEDGVDFCLAQSEGEHAQRGETLYTPEKFRRCLGLVLEGRVRVTRGEMFVGVLERGDVCSAVESMEPGYRLTQSFSSVVRLEPVWLVSTNAADYYMNAVTGQISRLTGG